MTTILAVALPLAALYLAFHLWYGGRGQPMSPQERDRFFAELDALDLDPHDRESIPALRRLMDTDDGREFVMQNLIRYRPRALYPPGSPYGDDPVAADKRYGRAIVPHLLRYGNLPIFIARRTGEFMAPEHAQAWHVVAMVRYRSRRDFLRFARAAAQRRLVMHKWAAIEVTHIFPVRPLISLFWVRAAVAAVLALLGGALILALH
jgi:hypothetical protein